MKLNVTFQSDVAVDLTQHPPGRELAEYLKTVLLDAEVSVGKIDNYEDCAWSLDVAVADQDLFLAIGYVGDGVYEWLLQIDHYVRLRDVFRRKQLRRQCETLAPLIHRVLAADAHFTNIRWHQSDFAEGNYAGRPDA